MKWAEHMRMSNLSALKTFKWPLAVLIVLAGAVGVIVGKWLQ
jgi:hypothetical protein